MGSAYNVVTCVAQKYVFFGEYGLELISSRSINLVWHLNIGK